MKKFFTLIVLTFLTISLSIPVLAQKIGKKSRVEQNVEKSVEKTAVKSLEFVSSQAYSDGSGVLLKWQTNYEDKNLGFFVFRIKDGATAMVSDSLVPGAYMKTGRAAETGDQYEFFDAAGDYAAVYFIQSFDANGKTLNSEYLYPRQVADLKEVGGQSADFYQERNKRSEPLLEKQSLNLPRDLKEVYRANDSFSDIDTQRLVAAQPGVKISVKSEGIYRVTRAQLEAAGFNVNSDPATWKLYLEGIEQSIIVSDGGTYIEFYGNGVDVPENDKKVYFLISGGSAGKRLGTTVLRPLGNVVNTTYNQDFIKKYRKEYAGNLLNGERENFIGDAIVTSLNTTINFNLSGIAFESGKARVEIKIQGLTVTLHNVNVTLNGETLTPISGVSQSLMTGYYELPSSYLREGQNVLEFRSTTGVSALDSIRVNFDRNYLAESNALSFYTTNYRSSTITGFTSPNIRVFDLTFPDSPTVITNIAPVQNGSVYQVKLPAHRGRVMYAVEDSAVKTPDSVVQNFPSTLTTPANSGEFLVITHRSFLNVAQNWANYRAAQGVTTKVVDIADVFDEYSYGEMSSLSIRDFLQYAKNNWQTPPKYVMLIGDASYDYRNYLGYGDLNFVPTKLVDTLYTETGSDETLADFDNDGLAEIPIGRISVRTSADATIALNKVIAFEATAPQGFNRGFLFAYDLPNGYDFLGVSQRLADLLPNTVTKTFVGREMANAQTLLINDMNVGRFFINYAGHGNATTWANTFFLASNISQLNNNNDKLSVYLMLTCLNGYFVDPITNRESLGETLLKHPNGGGAAVWASTGLTTPDIQEVMATRFYQKLVEGQTPRLGDLIKDAKSVVFGGRDVRLSWTLLGDPMLKVR